MPPKRKTVKKTVRKATPKTRTQSRPPEPEPEPEPVTESSPPAATEAPVPAASVAEETLETIPSVAAATATEALEKETGPTAANETLAEETAATATEPTADSSVAEETLATETNSGETVEPLRDAAASIATETLEEEAEPTAANETVAEDPVAMEPAGSKALAEEPAAAEIPVAETGATEAAEEASETGKKRKTITRVRKVVKKKIVKKLVPKTTTTPKEKSSKIVHEIQNVEAAAAAAPNANEQQQEVENPSSDDAPVLMETVPETTVIDAEKVVTVSEMVPDTTVLDVEKVEDVQKEEEKEGDLEMEVAGDEEAVISESSSRKKTEIFIGGLDRDAKEEDLRKVFGKVGEIVEVRMIMDGQSGKNKGYAFLRYADANQARKAVTQFEKVEVCGKLCGASALKGNDTIFLGNIDKKWKKEDIVKLLQEVGIEKIEAVTVMPDSNNADSNRGFAFLELETNKDAQNTYKKLQKKDAFGKGQNIKVAWAEPLNDPDEEEMKKALIGANHGPIMLGPLGTNLLTKYLDDKKIVMVKSVYIEGIPVSWNEEKVRESFKKFGEIERIVLARNIKSSKRKDFAFVNYRTREAALSCIESFDKEELTDNGLKVKVKVSLAKPVKDKQNKGGMKFGNKDSVKDKPKAVHRDTKTNISLSKGKSSGGGYTNSRHMTSSTNHELLHVLREQATWKQGQVGYAGGPTLHAYTHGVEGKRPFSSLGDEALYSDSRGYPRARLDSFPSTGSSYGAMPHGTAGPSHPYYQRQGAGYAAGALYGATDYSTTHQMRQGAPPYGSNYYSRH